MSVWSEGYDAYEDGLYTEDNPYNPDTEEDDYNEWLDGWQEAQYVHVGAL